MIEIREALEADMDDILALLGQLWPNQALNPDRLRAVMSRAMASEHQVYLSASDGERVVGFCSLTIKNNLWQAGNLGHVDELVVDGTHRGRGLGSRLLTRITDEARRRGCLRLELDSAFHRKEAHAFYARAEFEERGILFSKSLDGPVGNLE